MCGSRWPAGAAARCSVIPAKPPAASRSCRRVSSAASRVRRRRVRRVDHVRALGHIRHPQCDPQVGVGADVRGHHAGGALGGQDQVQAEGAAALGDADQAGHEAGQVAGQGRELVDHDHQPGQGRVAGLARGPFGVIFDVLGPGGGQDLLPAGQLGGQRGQGALGQVRVQVGDHPGHVRQVHAAGERAAALVVHQHERHLIRPVHQGQRCDQGLQQLGLPGAGGAGDQRVRAVPAQVDAERPVVARPDHRVRRRSGRRPDHRHRQLHDRPPHRPTVAGQVPGDRGPPGGPGRGLQGDGWARPRWG